MADITKDITSLADTCRYCHSERVEQPTSQTHKL